MPGKQSLRVHSPLRSLYLLSPRSPTSTWYWNATIPFTITGTNFEPGGLTTVAFVNKTTLASLNTTLSAVTLNTINTTTITGTVVVRNARIWNASVTTADGGTGWQIQRSQSVNTRARAIQIAPTSTWYWNATIPFTITGSNFEPGLTTIAIVNKSTLAPLNATTTWNTINATTITGTVVVPFSAQAGTWNVSVTTVDGGTGWLNSPFTVGKYPAPSNLKIAPTSTWYWNATIPFTITGSNFEPGLTTIAIVNKSTLAPLNATTTWNTINTTTIAGTVVVPFGAPPERGMSA